MGRQGIGLRGDSKAALQVLGSYIHEKRVARNFTAQQAGELIAVSARTWRQIERGEASVSVGHVFNAATVLGIPLFSRDAQYLRELALHRQQIEALLPERVRVIDWDDDDDF